MSPSLYMKFLRMRIKQLSTWRGIFLLGVSAQMLGFLASYFTVWLLLHRFHSLGGWSWPEVAFLYSLNMFSYSLGAAMTQEPMTRLEQLIRDGTLDQFLVKPVNTFLFLTASMFNLGYLAHILLSGSFLVWALFNLQIHWTAIRFIYLIISIIGAALLQSGIIVMVGCWAFKFGRSRFLFSLYSRIRQFISYPITVYSISVQVLLTAIVPLAFINYYPSLYLLGRLGSNWIWHLADWVSPLVGLVVFGIAYTIWNKGLNSYESTGH